MKYKIIKIIKGSGGEYFHIKYKRFHLLRCIGRHLMSCSNEMFRREEGSYSDALKEIKKFENNRLRYKTVKKESFDVYRTDVPAHIPKEQIVEYTSTKAPVG